MTAQNTKQYKTTSKHEAPWLGTLKHQYLQNSAFKRTDPASRKNLSMVACKEQQQIKSPILGICRIKKPNKALSSEPSDYSGPCAAPPIHSAEHLSWR